LERSNPDEKPAQDIGREFREKAGPKINSRSHLAADNSDPSFYRWRPGRRRLHPISLYRAGFVDRSAADLRFRRRADKGHKSDSHPFSAKQRYRFVSCPAGKRAEPSAVQFAGSLTYGNKATESPGRPSNQHLDSCQLTTLRFDSGPSTSPPRSDCSLTSFSKGRDPGILIRVAFRAIDLIQHLTVGFVTFVTDRFQTGGSKANETARRARTDRPPV
jgi:hypothetical protein